VLGRSEDDPAAVLPPCFTCRWDDEDDEDDTYFSYWKKTKKEAIFLFSSRWPTGLGNRGCYGRPLEASADALCRLRMDIAALLPPPGLAPCEGPGEG
jgi:hypothetical protein